MNFCGGTLKVHVWAGVWTKLLPAVKNIPAAGKQKKRKKKPQL